MMRNKGTKRAFVKLPPSPVCCEMPMALSETTARLSSVTRSSVTEMPRDEKKQSMDKSTQLELLQREKLKGFQALSI